MDSICVFCGSSYGSDTMFEKASIQLGQTLARRGITLIYGGANVGLMGTLASAAIEAGGKVIGVIPKFLQDKELAHEGLTELILCDSMHERKTKMFELSQGFIAMPGGFGTLEELAEMLTWHQLGLHSFPIGVLNINGFYNDLLNFFDTMVKSKLLHSDNRGTILSCPDVPTLLEQMSSYKATPITKWLDREST